MLKDSLKITFFSRTINLIAQVILIEIRSNKINYSRFSIQSVFCSSRANSIFFIAILLPQYNKAVNKVLEQILNLPSIKYLVFLLRS